MDGIIYVVSAQPTFSGNHVVKQKVISNGGTKLVKRLTFLPAYLEQIHIHEPFILNNMEFQFVAALDIVFWLHEITSEMV
jgi:hypothetical protein